MGDTRDRATRGRRDPADRRGGEVEAPEAHPEVPPARPLPRLPHRDRAPRGRGRDALPEPRLPGPAQEQPAPPGGSRRPRHRGPRREDRGPARRAGVGEAASPTSLQLDAAALAQLERMGEKSAANLAANLESARETTLARFLDRPGHPPRGRGGGRRGRPPLRRPRAAAGGVPRRARGNRGRRPHHRREHRPLLRRPAQHRGGEAVAGSWVCAGRRAHRRRRATARWRARPSCSPAPSPGCRGRRPSSASRRSAARSRRRCRRRATTSWRGSTRAASSPRPRSSGVEVLDAEAFAKLLAAAEADDS